MATKEKTKKFTITPRGKYVLVKPDGEESRVSEGGIYTPDAVEKEKKATGLVIAVSPDVKDIKKGQRVVYGTYAGDDMKIENVEHKLLHEDDIMAFVTTE